MWSTILTPTPMLSLPNIPPPPPPISATQPRRNHHQVSATSDTPNTALKSNPKNKGNGKEINGSDILWALQKAGARKAQIKKQQQQMKYNKGLKSGVDPKVIRVVDYDKIRPVNIKSDWTTRFDDLHERIQEFLSF